MLMIIIIADTMIIVVFAIIAMKVIAKQVEIEVACNKIVANTNRLIAIVIAYLTHMHILFLTNMK